MAMMSVVSWLPTGGLMVQADRLGPAWSKSQQPPVALLYLLHEPGELLQ